VMNPLDGCCVWSSITAPITMQAPKSCFDSIAREYADQYVVYQETRLGQASHLDARPCSSSQAVDLEFVRPNHTLT
jgi:hypothetical protein